MTEEDGKVKLRTFELVIGILLTIVGTIASWALVAVVELQRDVAVLKTNGSSTELTRRLDSIEDALKGYPPPWLKERVAENSQSLRELVKSVNEINVAIAALKKD